MARTMGIVEEIALLGIVEPVVGKTDVEPASSIGKGQVELLRITRIRDAYTTPCRERKALIADAKCGLEGYVAKILATPYILTYDICRYCCLYILCRSTSSCGEHHRH